MFRLLGFLIGSATSVFIILLVIGLPTFHLGDDDEAQQRYDAAIEMLRAKQQELESVAGRLTEDVSRVAESIDAEPAVPAASDPPAPAATLVEPLPAAPDVPPSTAALPGPAGGPHWYSFWNPFSSEIAASGFVAQLERVTGMDYRIVKMDKGVYEVAFDYADDAERRDKLSRISAATGLDLPES